MVGRCENPQTVVRRIAAERSHEHRVFLTVKARRSKAQKRSSMEER